MLKWIPLAINLFAVVMGVVAIRAWRQSGARLSELFSNLGFNFSAPIFREFMTGLLIGLAAMGSAFLVLLISAQIQYEGVANPGLPKGIELFVTMILVALIEEILFRSFLLNGLIHLTHNEWLAVLISAALFGLAHMANPSATWISILSTIIGGLMYGLAFVWTGHRLWAPVGLHFAWNFFQSYLFGFPVSGIIYPQLIDISDRGLWWITGGAYGPEGGLVGIAARLFIIGLLWLLLVRIGGFTRVGDQERPSITHHVRANS